MATETRDELVVLTQNAWGGAGAWQARRDLLVAAIQRHKPHVVGLQEVHAGDRSGAGSQAHEIAERVGGYDTYFAPGRVRQTGATEGVALLCRHGVREHALESLTLDPDDPWDGESQRVVLCAQLDAPHVDVFVTHLSLSAQARHRTVRELCGFARRERERSGSVGAVLMGDFNATPDDPAVQAILASGEEHGWTDTWTRANGRESRGGTWPAPFPFRRIDYLLVQPAPSWEVVACERLRFAGSDHLGVLARLRVRHPDQASSATTSTSAAATQKRAPSGAAT